MCLETWKRKRNVLCSWVLTELCSEHRCARVNWGKMAAYCFLFIFVLLWLIVVDTSSDRVRLQKMVMKIDEVDAFKG